MIDNFKRETYFENNDFRIYLEEIHQSIICHVVIHRATPSIIKDIKDKWLEIASQMYWAGYEELYAYTKDNRIIKMIGGAILVTEEAGYEVWKWELK